MEKTTINEFDYVRVKPIGKDGQVIDIYNSGGEKQYTVEVEKEGVPGGWGESEKYKLIECKEEELEKIND